MRNGTNKINLTEILIDKIDMIIRLTIKGTVSLEKRMKKGVDTLVHIFFLIKTLQLLQELKLYLKYQGMILFLMHQSL